MTAPAQRPRFKRRVCRQCGNDLVRLSPSRPKDDVTWATAQPEGIFFCEKCDIEVKFPLGKDEVRDIELAPRVRA